MFNLKKNNIIYNTKSFKTVKINNNVNLYVALTNIIRKKDSYYIFYIQETRKKTKHENFV